MSKWRLLEPLQEKAVLWRMRGERLSANLAREKNIVQYYHPYIVVLTPSIQ
jgi:hypothetical protein